MCGSCLAPTRANTYNLSLAFCTTKSRCSGRQTAQSRPTSRNSVHPLPPGSWSDLHRSERWPGPDVCPCSTTEPPSRSSALGSEQKRVERNPSPIPLLVTVLWKMIRNTFSTYCMLEQIKVHFEGFSQYTFCSFSIILYILIILCIL